MAYIFPQSFSRKVSLTHCLSSYRDEPTTSRSGMSIKILANTGQRRYFQISVANGVFAGKTLPKHQIDYIIGH